MDVSDGTKTPAGRDESVVRLNAGKLTYPADGHGGGGGGVRHPRGGGGGAGVAVAVIQLSLQQVWQCL